jgi:hypothetical protein
MRRRRLRTAEDRAAAIASSARRRWDKSGQEPSLDELLVDPVIEAVLRRDGLTRDDVMAVVRAARLGLACKEHRDAA